MNPANKQIIPFPGRRDRPDKDQLEFLPAALEIIETPASPLGRTIGLVIIVLFTLALAWAALGEVDIIASAQGKIIPNGRTKVIQPFETSVVRAIQVHNGQHVKTGDVLIELDPTMNKADREQQRNDLVAAQLDVARLKAALTAVSVSANPNADPLAFFHPPADASSDTIATQKRFLLEQVSEHRAKIASLERQKAEKEAEQATAAAMIAKLEKLIPILQARVDIRETLYNQQVGSKWNYLEILQAATEQTEELKVQIKRVEQAEASVATIIATLAQTRAEFGRTLSGELAEAQRKAGGLAQALVKWDEKVRLQVLTAPVDGIVQQLAVHTVGGVVTPAQTLLVLVPEESHLEIEANVSNRDIGFVHEGQPAEIKLDTFPWTKYGLLHGEVLSISHDAVPREAPPPSDGKPAPAQDSSSEPKGQELSYVARVLLDRTQMDVDGKLVNLSPGMAVTVEIRTGTRRVISYLLSPLLRYKQESLRER